MPALSDFAAGARVEAIELGHRRSTPHCCGTLDFAATRPNMTRSPDEPANARAGGPRYPCGLQRNARLDTRRPNVLCRVCGPGNIRLERPSPAGHLRAGFGQAGPPENEWRPVSESWRRLPARNPPSLAQGGRRPFCPSRLKRPLLTAFCQHPGQHHGEGIEQFEGCFKVARIAPAVIASSPRTRSP